jgi:hypothetical protein
MMLRRTLLPARNGRSLVPNNDLHRDGVCNQGSIRGINMRHALGVILLFVLGSANAATVVYSSPGVVTGIGGLDIGGTLYNGQGDGFNLSAIM